MAITAYDLETATEERDRKVKELYAARQEVTAMGITQGAFRNKSYLMDERTLSRRKTLVTNIQRLEAECAELATIIREHKAKDHNQHELLKAILQESLPKDQYNNILHELRRRMQGERGFRVNLTGTPARDLTPELLQLKEDLRVSYDRMLAARLAIDAYIAANMPVINKADYLLQIATLNRAMPSVVELSNKKNKIV